MKTKNVLVLLMVLMMSALVAFCANAKSEAKVENKLTAEESSRLLKRVEEIRDMDKSEMTVKEKKELKETKENLSRRDGYVYIGTGTLLLIILLIILL
jgi:glucosamine 6-phosphate synthetase-like amidotransferase/phosphosugar isomerase protein